VTVDGVDRGPEHHVDAILRKGRADCVGHVRVFSGEAGMFRVVKQFRSCSRPAFRWLVINQPVVEHC
jgi:hypothetical protein